MGIDRNPILLIFKSGRRQNNGNGAVLALAVQHNGERNIDLRVVMVVDPLQRRDDDVQLQVGMVAAGKHFKFRGIQAAPAG